MRKLRFALDLTGANTAGAAEHAMRKSGDYKQAGL